jgi:hypothetical protein
MTTDHLANPTKGPKSRHVKTETTATNATRCPHPTISRQPIQLKSKSKLKLPVLNDDEPNGPSRCFSSQLNSSKQSIHMLKLPHHLLHYFVLYCVVIMSNSLNYFIKKTYLFCFNF